MADIYLMDRSGVIINTVGFYFSVHDSKSREHFILKDSSLINLLDQKRQKSEYLP